VGRFVTALLRTGMIATAALARSSNGGLGRWPLAVAQLALELRRRPSFYNGRG
jgi:hypothetical protein